MIAIVSKDKDFSHELARQLAQELGQACEIFPEMPQPGPEGLQLVLSDAPEPAALSAPVLSLSRPLSLQHLLERVAAALSEEAALSVAPGLQFHPRSRRLLQEASAQALELTEKESELLQALLKAGEAGLSKEALLASIWGIEAELNTHTLETHIYRLRGKLKELGSDERLEATDGGYKLTQEK